MARRKFARNSRRTGRGSGDWEIFDGTNGAAAGGFPAYSNPPYWGQSITILANQYNTYRVLGMPPQRIGNFPGSTTPALPIGSVDLVELDVAFDLLATNPAAGPPFEGFPLVGIGLYKSVMDRGAVLWPNMDPLNPDDMTRDDWIAKKAGVFCIPTAQVVSATVVPVWNRPIRLGLSMRRRFRIGKGTCLGIGLSCSMPAGFVSLTLISWIRARFSRPA